MEKTGLLKGIDQFLLRLSPREKWMLGGGGLLALILIGYFMLFDPAWERMRQLESLIPRKEKALRDLMQLKEEWSAVSKQLQAVENRLPLETTFSPLSFLEENAAKNGIRGNIAFIRPLSPQTHAPYREIPVEVKVEDVSLPQIISFLQAIETAPQRLRIKRLAMKTRFSDKDKMDVTFLVLSYEKISS
ncbi:MAG: type II secretion system protein GspM [Nitrospiria bacterium]